jgi:hypothetical protein
VHNDTVTRAFRDVCRGFDQKDIGANVEMLFHGTTWDKANEFAENGFNIPAIRHEQQRLAGANLHFEQNPFKAMALQKCFFK